MQQKRINTLALGCLQKYPPKGRPRGTCRKAGQGGAAPAPEILSPEAKAAIPAVAPVDMTALKTILERMPGLLDSDAPQGNSDLFWLPDLEDADARLAKDIRRAERLRGYAEEYTRTVQELQRAIEATGSLNQEQARQHLNALNLHTELLVAQQRDKYASEAAARKNQVEAAKDRAEIARYDAEAEKHRRSAIPKPPAPPPPKPPQPPPPVDEATLKRQVASRRRQNDIAIELDEARDKAAAQERKIADAIKRCTEIYHDLDMREGDKRNRIQAVLDAYNLTASVLPVAIEDLMIREYEEVNS